VSLHPHGQWILLPLDRLDSMYLAGALRYDTQWWCDYAEAWDWHLRLRFPALIPAGKNGGLQRQPAVLGVLVTDVPTVRPLGIIRHPVPTCTLQGDLAESEVSLEADITRQNARKTGSTLFESLGYPFRSIS
jgi:hypothetical protein